MENRREFLKAVTAIGVAGIVGAPAVSASEVVSTAGNSTDDRNYWLSVTERIASPVLENLSRRELKKRMPVEAAHPAQRTRFTHLEAFGRLMAGVAPWLAAKLADDSEMARRQKFIQWSQSSLDAATDPASPDFMNFHEGSQPLVDAAFLAQGILRAAAVLWEPLDARVRGQIVAALRSSRAISTPTTNNWVMFAAMVEAALLTMGEDTVEDRLEGCVEKMLGWYAGDGAYGDGEFFHFDYYNSFVIQPMLLDVLSVLQQKDARFEPAHRDVLRRAQRYAAVLERLIAPDGTFPSLGRSTSYRFGAFHLLAQMALLNQLPEPLKPAQVRCALTAVIRKMIEAPGTFDDNGWLQIGFCGHQPSLAENYISTGSLYMCSAALLPLGLPPTDPFWSDPPALWTQQQLWTGKPVPADHAFSDARKIEVPTLHRNS